MQYRNPKVVLQAIGEARNLIGEDQKIVAERALRALLANGRSLEVAHQQIRYKNCPLAFSSRRLRQGEILIQIEVGNPRLAGYVITEDDLRRAEAAAALKERPRRTGRRR